MSRPWTPWQDLPDARIAVSSRRGLTARDAAAPNAIVQWASLVGAGVGAQVTAANQPTRLPDALGSGLPALSFDGTDLLTGLQTDFSSKSRTIVALVRFSGTGNLTVLGASQTDRFTFRRDGNRLMQAVITGTATIASDAVAIPNDALTLVTLRITEAGEALFRQNGVETARVTASGNVLVPQPSMQIGAAAGSQQMRGWIVAMTAVDGASTLDAVERAEGWVAHEAGRPDVLASGHPYRAAAPVVQEASAGSAATASSTFASSGASSSARGGASARVASSARSASSVALSEARARSASVGRLRSQSSASSASAVARASASGEAVASSRSVARSLASGVASSALSRSAPFGLASSPVVARGAPALADSSALGLASVASSNSEAVGRSALSDAVSAASAIVPSGAAASAELAPARSVGRLGRRTTPSATRTVRSVGDPRVVRPERESRVLVSTKELSLVMLSWPSKDPKERLEYSVDFSERLSGDTIVSAAWTVSGVVAERSEFSATVATVWLSGGEVGAPAEATCVVDTSGGRTLVQSARSRIVPR